MLNTFDPTPSATNVTKYGLQYQRKRLREIKRENRKAGNYFFSRDTMRFFGDTMDSFRICECGDRQIVYRRPNASVTVFGNRRAVGSQYFGAWFIENGRLIALDAERKDALFAVVSQWHSSRS